MKKTIILFTLILMAGAIFAQDTIDLNFKFKPKEIKKSNTIVDINGQMMFVDKQVPFKSKYNGIMTQETIEITKNNTFKNIIKYTIKDVQTNDVNNSEKVAPKSIGYEVDSKGKIYNVLNEKGAVTQKVNISTGQFPKDPIKVGDSWVSINNLSGITLSTQSTLKEVKEVNGKKIAVINNIINTPIDVMSLLQLMGLSQSSFGSYEGMDIKATCQGQGEILFDIDNGEITNETFMCNFYLLGTLYNYNVMQGQFQCQFKQELYKQPTEKK